MYPMALASLTSWGPQSIPGFSFTALYSGPSGPLYKDMPATHLAAAASLSHKGRFHSPFLLALTLTQNQMAEVVKFCCLLGLEHGILIQLHLHQLSIFSGFLQCLSLAFLERRTSQPSGSRGRRIISLGPSHHGL